MLCPMLVLDQGFRVFGADGVLIAHDTDWVNPYFKISRSDMAGWKSAMLAAWHEPPARDHPLCSRLRRSCYLPFPALIV